MKPKVYALYLPQFHTVKENSEWWGEGYTDWVAVKKAQSLFEQHYQPHVPLNNNYYDLTDVDTIRTQCKMAKSYGLDGFAIYHYWSNGKLLMEKPLELLLKNKDIDIGFFISWANHDFKQTWFGGDGHMMQAQKYGDEEEICAHYHYLSQFFRDERYLKINNKPVIKIFNIYAIHNFEQRLKIWNQMARDEEYDGIYVIANKCNTGVKSAEMLKNPYVNAVFIFEPMNVRTNGANEDALYIFKRRVKTVLLRQWNKYSNAPKPELFDYKKENEKMLRRKPCGKQFYCIFPNWDNTPRYGAKGIVFQGSTPELFGYYANRFYERSMAEGNELLFVNAWNEWGESAHLEPDKRYEFQYLEKLCEAINEK